MLESTLIQRVFKNVKSNAMDIHIYSAYFSEKVFYSKLMEYTKVDALLVGDSLGLMIKGENNTHKVTIDEICYHTKSVRKGTSLLPIISDMPINSFKNKKLALLNALQLIDAGADLIKIEGGLEVSDTIEFLDKNSGLVNLAICRKIP